jgi:predicted metal-dependent hydrolase
MAPVSQLNYVVAHELVHIKYKDHSPKFWKKLNSIMPDYQDRKEKLKQDGWQYEI